MESTRFLDTTNWWFYVVPMEIYRKNCVTYCIDKDNWQIVIKAKANDTMDSVDFTMRVMLPKNIIPETIRIEWVMMDLVLRAHYTNTFTGSTRQAQFDTSKWCTQQFQQRPRLLFSEQQQDCCNIMDCGITSCDFTSQTMTEAECQRHKEMKLHSIPQELRTLIKRIDAMNQCGTTGSPLKYCVRLMRDPLYQKLMVEIEMKLRAFNQKDMKVTANKNTHTIMFEGVLDHKTKFRTAHELFKQEFTFPENTVRMDKVKTFMMPDGTMRCYLRCKIPNLQALVPGKDVPVKHE